MQKISRDRYLPLGGGKDILPRPGEDVISTINIDIQDVAEQSLQVALERHKADHGCVVGIIFMKIQ